MCWCVSCLWYGDIYGLCRLCVWVFVGGALGGCVCVDLGLCFFSLFVFSVVCFSVVSLFGCILVL